VFSDPFFLKPPIARRSTAEGTGAARQMHNSRPAKLYKVALEQANKTSEAVRMPASRSRWARTRSAGAVPGYFELEGSEMMAKPA